MAMQLPSGDDGPEETFQLLLGSRPEPPGDLDHAVIVGAVVLSLFGVLYLAFAAAAGVAIPGLRRGR